MWAGTTPLIPGELGGPMPGTVSSLLFGLSRPFSLRDRLAEAEAIPFRQPGIHSDGLRLLRRLPLLLHRKLVSQCVWGGLLHRHHHHHHHHTAEKRWVCDERSSMKFQYYLALADRMRRRGGVIRWGSIERSGSKPVSVPPDRLFFSSSI